MSSAGSNRLARIAALVAVAATATIAAAWAFEIWGGYVPCALCLQERVPYYVGIPLAAVAAAAALRAGATAAARAALAAIALVFAYGAYLAAYHSGAEWGWWPGPSGCGGGAGTTTDAGSLLGQLRETRVVACDEAPWRLLGLSFAGWNFVISAALAGLALWGAARAR